jgi:hypothetical protein
MEKSGLAFLEGMPEETSGPASGHVKWVPYKLWLGDLWKCPGCGTELISGTGRNPISEHYLPDFSEKVKNYGPKLQVDDC